MKNIFKCLFMVLLLVNAANLYALTFNKVYLFGDSMSDGGWSATAKISAVKNGAASNLCGYESRMTNGLTAVESAVANLGMLNTASFENYAVSGASTYDLLTRTQGQTQVIGQINKMLSNNSGAVSANALSIIFMGANDVGAKAYMAGAYATANDIEIKTITDNAMANTVNAMNMLASKGAKKILLINLPNFKYWYGIKRLHNEALAEKMVINFNSNLSSKVNEFSQVNPTVTVKVFDLSQVSQWFFNAPSVTSQYSQVALWDDTELVEDSCKKIKAGNVTPDYAWPLFGKDIYFDDIHLTKRVHDYFGVYVLNLMQTF